MEFGDTVITAAGQGLKRIRTCYANILDAINQSPKPELREPELPDDEFSLIVEKTKTFRGDFHAAMDDDFNTADAITAIFELVRFINSTLAKYEKPPSKLLPLFERELPELCGILGISLHTEQELGGDVSEIEELIEARQEARKAKNFTEADRIRDELAAKGITLEDTPGGVRWRKS